MTPRRIFVALKPPAFLRPLLFAFSIVENDDKRCSLAAGKPIDFRPTFLFCWLVDADGPDELRYLPKKRLATFQREKNGASFLQSSRMLAQF